MQKAWGEVSLLSKPVAFQIKKKHRSNFTTTTWTRFHNFYKNRSKKIKTTIVGLGEIILKYIEVQPKCLIKVPWIDRQLDWLSANFLKVCSTHTFWGMLLRFAFLAEVTSYRKWFWSEQSQLHTLKVFDRVTSQSSRIDILDLSVVTHINEVTITTLLCSRKTSDCQWTRQTITSAVEKRNIDGNSK